jgi:anti-sigma factor RsiW
MDCRDVRKLADSYVGEELLTETNHAILAHVASCPACRADIEARRELRRALRVAFARAPGLQPRPEFLDQLSRLPGASAPPARGRSAAIARWTAIAAAVALVCAAGVWSLRARAPIDALLRAAVGDHRNCALHFTLSERPTSLHDAARQDDAAFGVFEQVPPARISTSGGVATVLERHSCVYQDRRFAHVVLRYRGTPISLVAARDARVGPGIGHAGYAIAASRVDGMTVISFGAGGHSVFLIGDLPAADLSALADVLSGDVVGALARL